MPYVVRKRKGKKCVYKKKKNGKPGEKVGCTKKSIKKYLAALHINANEGLEENKMKIKPSRLREIIQEEVSDFNSRMSAPPDDITGEPDDEGAMARSQLLKLAKYSAALMDMMNDNTQLPAWVQAKITKSASYLGAVKHFIEGELELNEAVDDDPQSNTISVDKDLIQKLVNVFFGVNGGNGAKFICQAAVAHDEEEVFIQDLEYSIGELEKILKQEAEREKQPKQMELPLNEEKQQMRKVTVEGKTYKVKK